MSHKNRKKRVRITRVINLLLTLCVVTMAMVAGGSRMAQVFWNKGELHAADTAHVQQVVVSTGDTLWGLALEHGPQGADPRQVVAQIRALNQMADVDLVPGMVLLIPSGV